MAENINVIDVNLGGLRNDAEQTKKSVDNLSDSIDDLKGSSDNLSNTLDKAASSLERFDNTADSVQRLTDGLGGLADTASGIAGGFAAVEGAMNLMGIQSEEITESILKLQSIMAITDGFDAIGRGVKGFYELSQIVKTSTVAMKALSLAKKADAAVTTALNAVMVKYTASTTAANLATKALRATLITSGIGAIVVGIGYAVDALMTKINGLKKETESLEDLQKKFGTSDGKFNALAGNIGILVESDVKKLDESIKKITDAYNNGRISLKEQYEQLLKAYQESSNKLQGYLKINNLSDENKEKIQSELTEMLEVQKELEKKVNDINAANEKAINEYNKYVENIKNGLEGVNKEISNFSKTQFEIFKNETNATRDNKLKKLQEANKHGLISEEEYLKQKAALNEMYDKMIADKAIEIELQSVEQRKQAIEAAEAQRQEEAQKMYDSITLELETKLANLYNEYNIKIAEADVAGKTIESAQLKVQLLKEEASILDEIRGKYEAAGLAEGVSEIKGTQSANQANQIYAEGDEKQSILDEVVGGVDAMSETVNTIISMAEGVDSAWGDVFANMVSGIENVGKTLKSGERGWKSYGAIATSTLQMGASVMNALASQQDADTKEGFETQKKFQIAGATMSMFAGIVEAWATAMTLGPILGPIFGGINSALIATMGALQIANIKKQTFEGGDSSSASTGTSSTPAVSAPSLNALAGIESGINYTTNIEGASVESNMTSQRVYVTETDITSAVNRVSVTESEAKY